MNNIDTKAKQIQNMVNISKSFIYPDYPELEIFGKQYYKKIISKLFNYDKNYSYIYFDVDGLNLLNNTCGKNLSDIALKYLLRIIKKSLPDPAIMCRIAGDEFCIILPNTDVEKAKEIESSIHSNIDFLSTFVYDLTITSSVKSSTMYSSIDEVEQNAEAECSMLKQAKKNKQLSKNNQETLRILDKLSLSTFEEYDSDGNNVWDVLNLSIVDAMKNYLKDLRPSSKFSFQDKDIKEQAFSIVSTVSRLVENKESDMIPLDIDKEDEIFFGTQGLEIVDIDSLTVKQIHTLFTTDENILDTLDEKNISRLYDYISILSDELVRDPHSGLLTKSYLNSYLAPKICESSSNYQVVFISDVDIRASNTAYGHNYSDMRIKKTVKKSIIDKFSKRFDFNNDAFTFDDNDIFLIDRGGGNYVLFIPSEQKQDEKEIFDMISSMNADVDIHRTNSTFFTSFSMIESINKSNPKELMKSITKLKNAANENKNEIKRILASGIDISNAFKKSIFECIGYYLDNVTDSSSITKKNALLKNIFTIMLNEFTIHNGLIQPDMQNQSTIDIHTSVDPEIDI